MNGSREFTLIITEHGAQLWDDKGTLKATLPEAPRDWNLALREALPPKASILLILAGPRLSVTCQEAPSLSPRERRDVHLRLLATAGGTEPRIMGEALDPDPRADGGYVLWTASLPMRDMDAWVDAIQEAGASLNFALPWQRAFLAAAFRPDQPSELFLTLEPGLGRLLFFQGRCLRYVRVFPLPEPMDLRPAGGEDLQPLDALVSRELQRLLQFVQQKHRGAVLRSLAVVGLPEGPAPGLVAMVQALGLALTNLGPDLPSLLRTGADRERRLKGGMDLVPEELREARRRRLFRTLVWASVGAMALLGAGAKAIFLHHERVLLREALRAEEAADRRKGLVREAEEAARLRFGLLRVRWGEARQKQAVEQLERLGLRLFQAPEGVDLDKVEVHQEPGPVLLHRFTVEGEAHTRGGFSMGTLADYYSLLSAHPGMQLDPLRDIAVLDRPAEKSSRAGAEQALTQFRFGGKAP